MENRQIWLKPKPTHIDENFEDFLDYLKSAESTSDALYTESLRLLRRRVGQLMEERLATPIYRQDKDPSTLKFNVRLCGAWLLAVEDASKLECKQVLLAMTNNLLYLASQSTITALKSYTFAYKKLPDLIDIALKLGTHEMPSVLPFSWRDLIDFSLDLFVVKLLKLERTMPSRSFYEGEGLMITSNGEVCLTNYPKRVYAKKLLHKSMTETPLLPEYGFVVRSDRELQVKESLRNEVTAIEDFAEELLQRMRACTKDANDGTLRSYGKGEYVPVEVTQVSPERIVLKSIDPNYQTVEGPLVFERHLKLFNRVLYPPEVWAKVLKVGDRLNAQVNPADSSFSLTNLFVDYIRDNVQVGEIYDGHNHKGPNSWLKLREFWTADGFMIFVDITAADNETLDDHDGYAGIELDRIGRGDYEGCLYGHICDYEAPQSGISREEVAPSLLRHFILEHSEIHLSEQPKESHEELPKAFVRELSHTLHILQSREVNPLLRYRILIVIRLLCTLSKSEVDDRYYQYISRYIQTLILFAKADSDEGDTITPLETPEELEDEEAINNSASILRILSCFAKDYEATSDLLDPYIDGSNEVLSKVASLVQAYNRLCGLLESKTLRGIKKQILSHLSVVMDGDSSLELASELEGIFGEEDDMKEFKSSFFEAPSKAKEQRQFYNIFRGICAMMNNRGGVLYLGVNDKGVPIGLKSDLDYLYKKHNLSPTLDAYMLHISKLGEEWFGETYWKYVTLRPMSEYNVVSITIEPYPYDIVSLKDGKIYLRKNNASAPIMDEETIADIRRRRQENLRKTDDKTINLQDAIQKGCKVRLVGYKSSSSGTIKNRVVEAFHIDNNEFIHCYEPKEQTIKIFRISRAERIVMLEKPWEHKDKHKILSLDPFNMSSDHEDQRIKVKLKLKLPAKNALEEQYPGISQYIRQCSDEEWMLEIFAYSLVPLKAFYLAHLQHVKIIDAPGLKEAVIADIKQNLHIN